ncbi:MAG: DUF1553 domain-containing protein, partial [Verrucomicrobia bacterium]|nr:DUF1553 domain-containing protein [Verrucomicrobiota bacterium]
ILAENCFHCHGPDPSTRKAGLRLDTEGGLFANRKNEKKQKDEPPTVIRHKPEESELFKRLITKDQDDLMPPPDSHKKLKPEEIALLKRWIDSGADWEAHWSLIPPRKAALPQVKTAGWAKNAIDRFVLAKLESKGLTPAPEASPGVLFRRLHLDITGLPPHQADIDAFSNEYVADRDEALSRWIERLMQSPAWGEHRARYWLDAARYADTHGLHFDNYREMWPYRDWVIRAFNANKPFSEFIAEQMAGDLLPQPTEDQLIATGFQRCGLTTNEGGTIAEENLAVYASERVQTMGWVFLGLTMNCAQCHDHKFDPLTSRDYYSMAAFFRNTTQGAFDGNSRDGNGPVLVLPGEKDRARWLSLPGIIKDTTAKRDDRRKKADPDFKNWLDKADLSQLEADLPSRDLLVHAVLNDGMEGQLKIGGSNPETAHAGSRVEWVPGGYFGPAPVVKSDATLSLGNIGDFDANQAFSYGAWVKTSNNEASGAILSRMNSAQGFKGYDLYQDKQTFSVHIAQEFPANALKVETPKVVKAGQWQHVFVSYDGSGKESGIKITVDGKEQKLKATKATFKPGSSIRSEVAFYVGQRSKGSVWEGGAVQDVRIYARALSVAEMQTLAEFPAISKALTSGPRRTAAQQNMMLDYFLNHHDAEYQKLVRQLASAEAERAAIRERSPLTHIQEEVPGKMPMAQILIRGQYNKPGETVEAEPPAALHPLPGGVPKNRLGLAQWLVDKQNALTPRVTVNRFWQEVFGQGLVKTADDFGVMGAEPSNQALLDYLAAEFRDNGGDVQALFKLMLTSATYRQSGVVTPVKLEKDRDNAFLSRGPRFRMDAEMLRDYALASSGLLSKKMYGPGTRPYQPEGIWDVVGLPNGNTRKYVEDKGEGLYRRTVYNFWKRMAPSPNMEAFNAPARDASCVRRDRTNTPIQALVTLNDPQFVEAARILAQNALLRAGADEAKAVDFIMRRTLGRAATDRESGLLLQSWRDFLAHYQQKPEDATALLGVGESKPDAKLSPPQLAAWTMVCNQVLNLDETLNK